MKFVVLLALVGLANCRTTTTLIGGERARDVSLKYSFLDATGREVDVKLEADRLGLGLGNQPVSAPVIIKAAPAPAPALAPAPAAAPVLLKAAPAPVITNAAPAPVPAVLPVRFAKFAPAVATPYIQTVALPAVAPAPVAVKQFETRTYTVPVTRYVAAAAPVPTPVFAPAPVTQTRIVTQFVRINDDDDDDVPVFRFVQPAAQPLVLAKTAPVAAAQAPVPLRAPVRRVKVSDDSSEK